jgi:hypothetical protein
MGHDIETTTRESDAKHYADAAIAERMGRIAMRWIENGPFAYDFESAAASDGNGFVIRCKRCGMFAT